MIASTFVRQQAWHTLDELATAALLRTDIQAGLSHVVATALAEEYGQNSTLHLENRVVVLHVLRLFQNPIFYIFLAAAAVVAGLGRWGYVAMFIGLLAAYAATDAIRVGRVKRSLIKLRALSTLKVQVMRQGLAQKLTALDLVPGDLLILQAGDMVVADGRLIYAEELTVAEVALTGEPMQVNKNTACLAYEVGLAGRSNMIFAGTRITAGRGRAVVTATGIDTVIARIAVMAVDA